MGVSCLTFLSLGLFHCAAPRLLVSPAATEEARARGAELYQAVVQRNQAVRTLRGIATLDLAARGFSRATTQAIVIQRPASVRIDSYTDWGERVQQLIYHRGHLILHWPRDGIVREGDEAHQFLEGKLKLPVPLADLAVLLSGGIPLEARHSYLGGSFENSQLLRGEESHILLAAESLLPQEYRARVGDTNRFYTVTFDNYQQVGHFWFPQCMTLYLGRPRAQLTVNYQKVELNRKVAPTVFIVSEADTE